MVECNDSSNRGSARRDVLNRKVLFGVDGDLIERETKLWSEKLKGYVWREAW